MWGRSRSYPLQMRPIERKRFQRSVAEASRAKSKVTSRIQRYKEVEVFKRMAKGMLLEEKGY